MEYIPTNIAITINNELFHDMVLSIITQMPWMLSEYWFWDTIWKVKLGNSMVGD